MSNFYIETIRKIDFILKKREDLLIHYHDVLNQWKLTEAVSNLRMENGDVEGTWEIIRKREDLLKELTEIKAESDNMLEELTRLRKQIEEFKEKGAY